MKVKQRSIFDDDMRDFLDELKTAWRETIGGEGGHCPCCEKFGKIHEMKLSQHLAMCLKWIALNGDKDGWVDVQNKAPRFMLKAKTYPCLAYWGLIEGKGSRSGIWKATDKGFRFMHADIKMPERVYIYDNRVWEFSATETTFRGCFGKHFDFDEMMSSRFDWTKVTGRIKKND
jgi:hypothetical protein